MRKKKPAVDSKDVNGKKKWMKPMLIVLFRGDRRESVLGLCKFWGNGTDGGSPTYKWYQCQQKEYDWQDKCTKECSGELPS